MSGIVFLATRRLDDVISFYVDRLGCSLWMDQEDCRIVRHGSFLLGFCQRDHLDTGGVLSFNLTDREAVDNRYADLEDLALEPPADHARYPVYSFFLHDPENRVVEFECFSCEVDWAGHPPPCD